MMIATRRVRAAASSVALGLSTTLAACGGGGGTSSAPIVYDNHLPMQLGDRWAYRLQDNSAALGTGWFILTESVIDTRDVDGTPHHLIVSSGGKPERWLYAASALGIRVRSPLDPSTATDLVRFPTHEGNSFVVGFDSEGFDRDFDGNADPYSARSTTSTVAVETLSTPAGTFTDALHVRVHDVMTVRLTASGTDQTSTSTRDTWYVPGVGRVRWEWKSADSYSVGELMRHVPAARPDLDTVAPVLVNGKPSSASTLHPGAPLVLTFNEPVTTASRAAVSVTNGEGYAVPLNQVGPFDPDGRSVNLLPQGGWGEGTHTVRIAEGVQDLAGNAMVALPDSTFTVSADFALVDSLVPRFAVDVERYNDRPLTASMNRSIDPSTVVAVRLLENGSVVPAKVSLGVDMLQVIPSKPLKASTRYTVDLKGLRSTTGLELVNPGDWTFTTAAPRH